MNIDFASFFLSRALISLKDFYTNPLLLLILFLFCLVFNSLYSTNICNSDDLFTQYQHWNETAFKWCLNWLWVIIWKIFVYFQWFSLSRCNNHISQVSFYSLVSSPILGFYLYNNGPISLKFIQFRFFRI
jgi:hypothetical protein